MVVGKPAILLDVIQVTPLSPAEWQIQLAQGRATLRPSIGNWSMACQSHYLIRDNRVIWSGQLSKRQIKAVFERDQRDLQAIGRRQLFWPAH
jgi:hypothetical protein